MIKTLLTSIKDEKILCTWCTEFEVFYHYAKPAKQFLETFLTNFLYPIYKHIDNPDSKSQKSISLLLDSYSGSHDLNDTDKKLVFQICQKLFAKKNLSLYHNITDLIQTYKKKQQTKPIPQTQRSQTTSDKTTVSSPSNNKHILHNERFQSSPHSPVQNKRKFNEAFTDAAGSEAKKRGSFTLLQSTRTASVFSSLDNTYDVYDKPEPPPRSPPKRSPPKPQQQQQPSPNTFESQLYSNPQPPPPPPPQTEFDYLYLPLIKSDQSLQRYIFHFPKRLHLFITSLNIKTIGEFARLSTKWVKDNFSQFGETVVDELKESLGKINGALDSGNTTGKMNNQRDGRDASTINR
eukprot:UN06953